MGSATFGRMQEFVPESESITAYLERIDLFFAANDVAEDKRVPVLLSVVGMKPYALLRSLLAPKAPKEHTFAALVETLKKHFEPQPLIIAERFNFTADNSLPGETERGSREESSPHGRCYHGAQRRRS